MCPSAVVGSGTLVIQQTPVHMQSVIEAETEPVSSSSTSSSGSEVYSNIRVVQELVDRVVAPAAHLPRYVQFKGER